MDKTKQDAMAVVDKVMEEMHSLVKGQIEKAEDAKPKTPRQDIRERLDTWTQIWKDNGYHRGLDKNVTLNDLIDKSVELASKPGNDAVTSAEYRNLIPHVVSNVIREPLPQNNPLTQMLTQVRFQNGTSITFPAVGAAGNLELDMAEGEEYPELTLDYSGSVTATIGKVGIAVNFTEEAIRYSAFDIVNLHSRQARMALDRHKEKKAADLIFNLGSTFIDNIASGARRSKGRDINGNGNWTLIVDDLIDAYIDALQEGWYLDTLVCHPLAWTIFAKDPILREQFFRGQGGAFWTPPTGGSVYAPQLGVNVPYGKNVGESVALGATSGTSVGGAANATFAFQVPGYGGLGFNIIVTPYATITWNSTLSKWVTDIVMLQADQAGLLVVDEDLYTEDWNDPRVDVYKIKFRERYSMINVNQGKAARVLKNIAIDQAYFMEDKVTWDISNGELPTISAGIEDSSSSSST